MDEGNDIHCSHTIAGHAGAAAVVAQDRMDPLADRLGSVVLAPIRASEFSFLLRSRKCVDRNRLVVGESADFVLGGLGLACVPDDLHRGLCQCLTDRTHLVGGTEYMFDPGLPLTIRLLSLFHIVTPPLLLYAIWRLGYDPRGWKLQTLMAWIVVP